MIYDLRFMILGAAPSATADAAMMTPWDHLAMWAGMLVFWAPWIFAVLVGTVILCAIDRWAYSRKMRNMKRKAAANSRCIKFPDGVRIQGSDCQCVVCQVMRQRHGAMDRCHGAEIGTSNPRRS